MATPLDISDFVYRTGTLSIEPGDTTAVFSGSLLTLGIKEGDWLFAGGSIAVIETVTDDTHVELFTPWAGAAVADGSYVVLKASLLRYHTALVGYDTAAFLAALDGLSVFYAVTGDNPDPSFGEDDNYALKTNAGAWRMWVKVDGVWELQATPVGVNWRGAWDSGTNYIINDLVSYLGSTYTALNSSTNSPPASNPADWDLSSSKGDPGRDGGVIAIPYTFSSTTSDGDPGAGALRIGPGASQKAATVWRVDLLDSDGKDWSGTLADMASGTSAIKCAARLYKKLDQTARIVGNVTAFATPTGYRNLTFVATSGDDNPFTNGDAVVLVLDRNGDKGDKGDPGPRGSTNRGTWASITAYVVDDVVQRSGSSYISIQAGTNKDPISEPTYWSVQAAKGDVGPVPIISGTSTTSLTVGTGAQSLTVQAGLAIAATQRLRIANASATRVMVGTVTSYDSVTGELVMSVDDVVGAGTGTAWIVTISGEKGLPGPQGTSLYWAGAWSSATSYAANDLVSRSGKVYISILAGTNQDPVSQPTYWSLLFDPAAPADQITVQAKAANYTAAGGDRATMLRFTASATLSLAAAATLANGWYCYVKADGAAVTIDPDSSELIDGATTLVLANGSSCIVICTGAEFITFRTSSGGGSLSSIVEQIKTADYTTLTTDVGTRILMNSASAHTINLIAAATAGAGFAHWVRNINTGLLTVDANGSETIDGDLTFVLDKDEEALLSCTGTGWRKTVFRSEGHLGPETDVATASTMDIGATNTERVRATGTTTITSFGARTGKVRRIRFTGQTTVVHNGTSLFVPGESNITFDLNDVIEVVSDASGNWRIIDIQKNLAPARGKLTANRIYYVRTDGSNSNTGLANTSGGAFLTVTYALSIAAALDFNGFTVTIQIADGTYTESVSIPNCVGQASRANLVIQGNNTTPANVVITQAGSFVPTINVPFGSRVTLKDFWVAATNSGRSFFNAGGDLAFGNIDFGVAGIHMYAQGGLTEAIGNWTISGDATVHINAAASGAFVKLQSRTVTASGTRAFSFGFVWSDQGGAILAQSMTFTGTYTGSRYQASLGGSIQTYGGGGSYFPGNAGGNSSTGYYQ